MGSTRYHNCRSFTDSPLGGWLSHPTSSSSHRQNQNDDYMVEISNALRTLAESLPAGTAIPVPREVLLPLLIGPQIDERSSPAPVADQLLTARQAAKLLNVSPQWLYKNPAAKRFRVQLGRRAVRFSKAAIDRWLSRHTGAAL